MGVVGGDGGGVCVFSFLVLFLSFFVCVCVT